MRTTRTTATAASFRGLLWLGAVTLVASYVVPADAPRIFRLQLLHTNDMHSQFDEFNMADMPCTGGEECYGGFPRLKAAVLLEREKAARVANPPADGTLFLNAGDTFQGTTFYTYFKWTVVAALLPELGIDVMSLGNHEFDGGVNDLNSFLQSIKIPVVACNLDLTDEPLLKERTNLTKSTVVNVNGTNIGIIGYLTPETATLSKVGKVKFEPEIISIQNEAQRLKSQDVKIIIALGHSGFPMDVEIAKHVDEVDVVIGGHDNTFLFTGTPPDAEKPTGDYPTLVKHLNNGRSIPVVQAFHITKYLGRLWVEFDEEGEVISCSGNPILLNSSIEQNPELLVKVNKFETQFDEWTKEVLGSTAVFLNGACRLKECNFGNFLTDSYVNYNAEHNKRNFDVEKFWTDAPIALLQGGGIRASIRNDVNDGKITIRQLKTAIPFDSVLGKDKITGMEIKDAVEKSFLMYDGTTERGEFLQVSGLKIEVDLKEPGGQRVQSIQVRSDRKNQETTYEGLDLTKLYTVIMSLYLWEGGNGFNFTKSSEFKTLEQSDVDIIKEQIKLKSPLSPTVEDRIKMLNVDHLKNITPGSSTDQQKPTTNEDNTICCH